MNDSKPKQNKRALKAILLLTALIVVAALAVTTVAYLVKHDRIDNTLTPAKLDIELIEADWYNEGETTVTQIKAAKLTAPGSTIPKAPKIKNKDATDAYVFLEVTVPYFDNDDGAKLESSNGTPTAIAANEKVPMYKFVKSDGTKNETYTSTDQFINEGWMLVQADSGYTFNNPKVSGNGTDKKLTYVYAYASSSKTLTVLQQGEQTGTLFDYVFIPNFSISKTEMSRMDKDYNIEVKAYGIQTKYLEDNVESSSSDSWTPYFVWTKIKP